MCFRSGCSQNLNSKRHSGSQIIWDSRFPSRATTLAGPLHTASPLAPSCCTAPPRPTDSESHAERLCGSGLLFCPGKSAMFRGRAGSMSSGFLIPIRSREQAGHRCCCSLALLPNTGQRVHCIPARQRLEPEECCSYVQHLAFSADEIPPCIAAGRATSRPAQPMPIGPVPASPCFPQGYNAARALTPLRQHPAVLVGRSVAGGIAGLSRPAGLAAPCPTPRCGSPARTSSGLNTSLN